VDVDGGELVLGYGRSDDENCQAYLPQLSLRNGARVTGLPPYVGKLLSNGVWKVGGTSPSVCSNGIILVGTDDAAAFASKWVLDVSDTRTDGAADFMLCGDVTQNNPESNHRIEVEKCGNGVVGHDGDWNASVLRVIKDGAWRFVSNSGNENADISLEGGNLEFADGTETRLGTLTVSASATLTLGAGAQVAFADSALETWNLADGEMIDVIAGNFFVCGLGEEDFTSLRGDLQEKYLEKFRHPEKFMKFGDQIMAFKIPEKKEQQEQSHKQYRHR
jgi:hypothetical protein